MEAIIDRSFIEETVDVDGKTFVRCTFERCVFEFHGREAFDMAECHIGDGCFFGMAEYAEVVSRQLRVMLSYGGMLGGAARYFLSDASNPTVGLH